MTSVLWNKFLSGKKEKLSDILKKVKIFSQLKSKEIKEIIKIGNIRSYKDGEVIFRKGENSYGMFIILKGNVDIYLKEKKKITNLASYSKYEYFGEISLVVGNIRTANTVAKGDTKLFYIFRDDFKHLIESNQKVCFQFYENLIQLLVEKIEYFDTAIHKQKQ